MVLLVWVQFDKIFTLPKILNLGQRREYFYVVSINCERRQPDMHVQNLKSIHFLKPLLKGVVLQKTEFDFVAHVWRTKPNSVEKLLEPKFPVLLQFHKFLGGVGKEC